MKNIIKIYLADLRRLSKNVVAVVVIMGLSILPSLYAWFNIFSNWDPYGPDSTSNLKVAVVSLDEGVDRAGMEINVGDTVIEGLQTNHTIGWVFEDSEEALEEGVRNGDYYAALVVPKDFSKTMMSFLSGEPEHPRIIYYENEKKNAIAPKITGKAKTAIQEQVNSAFLSTLAGGIMEVSNALAGSENALSVGGGMEKLAELRDNLQIYSGLLNSFSGIMDSAAGIIDTTKSVVPDLNNMINSGKNTLNQMQGVTLNGSGNAEALADVISYSFDMIDDALEDAAKSADSKIESMENGNDTRTDMAALEAVLPYVKELFNQTVSGWENEETKQQIEEIKTGFNKIEEDMNAISASSGEITDQIAEMKQSLKTEIEKCRRQVQALADSFEYSVKPSLRGTMTSIQNSMLDVQTLLGSTDGDFSQIEEVLSAYQNVLEEGNASLDSSKEMTNTVIEKLDAIISEFTVLKDNEQYQKIMDMLETEPQLLTAFISSPVSIYTEQIYPIANYGSAMTPFYTILALWVGALILVAIIHVKVIPEGEFLHAKHYEKFFGRYLTFFFVGQAQTLITVLGELFYIKIQCQNPFLFWLAAAITSLVFTLFIYSLTVAFGNVGEALAVIIMVIQVAGAGGTFPIETLPKVYQYVYKFLPFTHGMNAMRETIGGMYGEQYLHSLGIMGIYVLISLFIGLVVAIPFKKVNEMVERSKEKSDIMI